MCRFRRRIDDLRTSSVRRRSYAELSFGTPEQRGSDKQLSISDSSSL
jgi:hypothetical protein